MSPADHSGTIDTSDAADPVQRAFAMEPAEVERLLGVDPGDGLSGAEVERRLQEVGPNQLDEPPRRPGWRRFLDQFNNVLVYILIGAAAVSAAVGDVKDPIVIAIVLLINAILGYVQESKADDALAALKEMLEVIVRVRRDGEVREVPAWSSSRPATGCRPTAGS
jgi:Ca2+-transporting ATPase